MLGKLVLGDKHRLLVQPLEQILIPKQKFVLHWYATTLSHANSKLRDVYQWYTGLCYKLPVVYFRTTVNESAVLNM